MYVRVCVCTYVCMYVCVYVRTDVCMYACVCVRMCTCMSVRLYVCAPLLGVAIRMLYKASCSVLGHARHCNTCVCQCIHSKPIASTPSISPLHVLLGSVCVWVWVWDCVCVSVRRKSLQYLRLPAHPSHSHSKHVQHIASQHVRSKHVHIAST